MFSHGNGILAIWHNLEPTGEANFREWHSREHMLERLAVPGFLLGCRYEAVDSTPLVFNFYLTESPETLTSADYLERLNNPSEWTKRTVPSLRDVYRAAGRVIASAGAGQGGAMATLRFDIVAERNDRFSDWFVEDGMKEMLELPGLIKTHLWQSDNSASGIETVESSARGGNSGVLGWTIAIEGNDISCVQSACKWLGQQQSYIDSLQGNSLTGVYRLTHRLGCSEKR